MSRYLAATELAAHWLAFRRALKGNEGSIFAWTSIGYRIKVIGTALRDSMGFKPDEHCFEMLVVAGGLTFAGRRGKRHRTFYRTCNRMMVPASSIPDLWDTPFGLLRRSKPSRKRYKTWKAIVRGTTVFIRYKDRETFYKACELPEEANMVAARINRKPLPVAKLKCTFPRMKCPTCGKSVAANWVQRHKRTCFEKESK